MSAAPTIAVPAASAAVKARSLAKLTPVQRRRAAAIMLTLASLRAHIARLRLRNAALEAAR